LNSTEELQNQKSAISKKVPLSEQALPEFTDFKDREYYAHLEDLAYVLATQQHEYNQDMRHSMKKSRVKEGILNLTKGDKIDRNNNLILNVKDKIDVIYEKKGKIKSKKLKIKQLLKRLSHDINIYFPIDEHRNNVLTNGEDYWVAFNPPDHDTTEYFVRAFNPHGKDSLISSKKGIDENLLIIAYSENQEYYSPDLMMTTQSIVDCPDNDPCLPDRPNPDPLPDPDPNPGSYEKGLNLTSIRTKNIDDGYFDGDLELNYKITQPAFSGVIDIPYIGETNFTLSASNFIGGSVNHDVGHWYMDWFVPKFRNSNKKTFVNARRRASERYFLYDVPFYGLVYYDEFQIRIVEEDVVTSNDVLVDNRSFNLKTQTFGVEWNIWENKVWIQLDYKDFPSNSY
jgi:hypothetical protein